MKHRLINIHRYFYQLAYCYKAELGIKAAHFHIGRQSIRAQPIQAHLPRSVLAGFNYTTACTSALCKFRHKYLFSTHPRLDRDASSFRILQYDQLRCVPQRDSPLAACSFSHEGLAVQGPVMSRQPNIRALLCDHTFLYDARLGSAPGGSKRAAPTRRVPLAAPRPVPLG
jgi:hypothetical protein